MQKYSVFLSFELNSIIPPKILLLRMKEIIKHMINKADYLYIDAVKTIKYFSDGEYGFIWGFKCENRIHFSANTLKACISNFTQLIEKLENGGPSAFPVIWFSVGENEQGFYVKKFFTKRKFKQLYQNDFINEFGTPLKNDIVNGKCIDVRSDLLLYELFGDVDYNNFIHSRYENNNSLVSKWNLGFLPPYEGKVKSGLKVYVIDDTGLKPRIDIDVPEFIKSKVVGMTDENQLTPVFVKLGKNVLGFSVVTDIQRYDPLAMPENSDEKHIKKFIETKLTDPRISQTGSFWVDCYNVLFTQIEKDALQMKKEQLLQEYLTEQEKEELRKEQAKIAIIEQSRMDQEQRRKREIEIETQAEAEYQALLVKLRPLKFTKTSQVSQYIMNHNLKSEFGLISGIARMQNGDSNWNYPGAIHPKFFARLCNDLGLEDNNTESRVVGYSSFFSKNKK